MITTTELFDLSHTAAALFLRDCVYPWLILPRIRETVLRIGALLPESEYTQTAPGVWIAKSAAVAPTACILPPAVIGPRTEVRHGAFLRGGVLVGADAVVGNSTEVKNAILFDGVQVPHYNYVGDSILGHRAHLGAGAITSNVRCDKEPVVIRYLGESVVTGRKKVGAMVGDGAEVGCNSVLNPGCILGRGSVVYPLCSVRGGVAAGGVWQNGGCDK